jgi:hypothetical protein
MKISNQIAMLEVLLLFASVFLLAKFNFVMVFILQFINFCIILYAIIYHRKFLKGTIINFVGKLRHLSNGEFFLITAKKQKRIKYIELI